MPGYRHTLEWSASQANAKFFDPPPLPPAAPLRQPPLELLPRFLQEILNEPAQQVLGSAPRIGSRAATHYGVDREAWEHQAALRW